METIKEIIGMGISLAGFTAVMGALIFTVILDVAILRQDKWNS